MIKKIHTISGLILLIGLCLTTDLCTAETQKQKGLANYKTTANHPARASPLDTCQHEIQIDGQSNVVTINDRIMVSSPDSTVKQNNIRVKGEGNTITVLQNDNKSNSVTVIQNDTNSKVTVSQSGSNNKVKISQNNQ